MNSSYEHKQGNGGVGVTKNEREILSGIVDDIENSDDKIWPLEILLAEVKRMIKHNKNE